MPKTLHTSKEARPGIVKPKLNHETLLGLQRRGDCLHQSPEIVGSSHVPQTSHGSFHRVNLEGRNVGASMVMRRGASDESPDSESCSINIYINNNVQGVNNSALLGSQVKMGDPGVYLTFRGVKFNEDSRETNKRNGESNEKGLGAKLGFCGKFLLVFISFLLLLCFL
ncbi:hypothetical protein CK203_069052 [Vitis vinifera]|uniref:Uncharacterized protein n=1 Tax=Vitis vinifera TaxID=29760 RepID=A0A438F124_VITVI|nr:hypothetical protein CK203_069052 [Vitis vinifera]